MQYGVVGYGLLAGYYNRAIWVDCIVGLVLPQCLLVVKVFKCNLIWDYNTQEESQVAVHDSRKQRLPEVN